MVATERFFSRMAQNVALEIRSMFGGVIALCASKRLLTTMNQHMPFQIAWPIACVVALVATVGLLSIIQTLFGILCKFVCLGFHVFFQPKICEVVFNKVERQLIHYRYNKKQTTKLILGK